MIYFKTLIFLSYINLCIFSILKVVYILLKYFRLLRENTHLSTKKTLFYHFSKNTTYSIFPCTVCRRNYFWCPQNENQILVLSNMHLSNIAISMLDYSLLLPYRSFNLCDSISDRCRSLSLLGKIYYI